MSQQVKPLITCSILCHNYGRFLRKAIDSCLAQNPGNYDLDVLVIDDGSEDETEDVCKSYGSSVRVSRSANLGFGESLSRGIREAIGEFVCLLDADDWLAPNKLVSLLPLLSSGCLYVDHPSMIVNQEGVSIPSQLGDPGNTSTICVQRRAALTMLPVENEIYFHPIGRLGKSATLKEALTYYRVHGHSMMGSALPNVWYQHLSDVTHHLADRLVLLSRKAPWWADSRELFRLSFDYRSIAHYDMLEAALQTGHRFRALYEAAGMLASACKSRSGITSSHLRITGRAMLGRRIRCRSRHA